MKKVVAGRKASRYALTKMNATFEIEVSAEQLDLINKALRNLWEKQDGEADYKELDTEEKKELEELNALIDLTDTQSDLLKKDGVNSFIR